MVMENKNSQMAAVTLGIITITKSKGTEFILGVTAAITRVNGTQMK